mmetsp:Transcript_41952/g.89557  ORF Transcript_41952/g.89557 Transcript_41952/m.89557 type:complete len:216 (+) Transcript_41952:963-1610(+)
MRDQSRMSTFVIACHWLLLAGWMAACVYGTSTHSTCGIPACTPLVSSRCNFDVQLPWCCRAPSRVKSGCGTHGMARAPRCSLGIATLCFAWPLLIPSRGCASYLALMIIPHESGHSTCDLGRAVHFTCGRCGCAESHSCLCMPYGAGIALMGGAPLWTKVPANLAHRSYRRLATHIDAGSFSARCLPHRRAHSNKGHMCNPSLQSQTVYIWDDLG